MRPSRLLPAAYRSLLGERHFRTFMPMFALSDLGDGMSVVAVAWLALSIAPPGGQGVVVGAAVAAYILPSTVGSLVLARWARRLSARRLLMADGWLRACALAAVPVAHVTTGLPPVLYVTLLAVSSLCHAWGKAGRHALFAQLLPPEQRLAANAVLSTSVWSSLIAGPALAGLLASVISPAWIIGLDAATFAVLAMRATTARIPAGATAEPPSDGAAAGLRVFLHRPELSGLLVVTWLFNAFFGPAEAALPVFVARELGAGGGTLGAYWSAFGIGAVVGTLALGLLRRLPMWPVMLGIIAGHGICMLPFAWHTHWAPSLAGFALAGVIYGPYSALSFTLIQERTPAASLTTVLAARNAVVVAASPLGAASAGPLLDRIGAGAVLVGSGLAMLVLALAAALVIGVFRLRGGERRACAVDGPAKQTPEDVTGD